MAKKNDAKRAAKKHAKEKKRQKKLAARDVAFDPIDRWRPAEHGIEGLARLLKSDSHHAAIVADLLAAEGKKGAADTWHPARVAALGVDSVVAGLAERGIATDATSFAAQAAGHTSARALAVAHWAPSMRTDATVHDRDFVGEAAEVLWNAWAPERLNDEQLADRVALLYADFEERPDGAFVADFLAIWASIRELGGLARFERAVGSRDGFVATFLDALEAYDEADDLPAYDAEAAVRALRELRAECAPGTQVWTGITLRLARLLDDRGRGDEALEDLLVSAAAHPALPALPMEAVELFLALPEEPPGLYERVAAAVRASIAAGPPKFRELGATLLAYLDESRAAKNPAPQS